MTLRPSQPRLHASVVYRTPGRGPSPCCPTRREGDRTRTASPSFHSVIGRMLRSSRAASPQHGPPRSDPAPFECQRLSCVETSGPPTPLVSSHSRRTPSASASPSALVLTRGRGSRSRRRRRLRDLWRVQGHSTETVTVDGFQVERPDYSVVQLRVGASLPDGAFDTFVGALGRLPSDHPLRPAAKYLGRTAAQKRKAVTIEEGDRYVNLVGGAKG